MNIQLKSITSLFKDRSTLILRKMMSCKDKKWSVRELSASAGVSVGLVSRTLGMLNELGLIEAGGRGCFGYSLLKDRSKLLDIWTAQYDFSLNKLNSFYSPDPNAIEKVVAFLKNKNINYALTLHSGANLLINYFSSDQCHIYVDQENIDKLAANMSANVILKRLTKGGNIHFVRPYYKVSAYHGVKNVKGMNVVSSLQLYIDLFRFLPRGNEHALYLKEMLGDNLYG